MAEATRKPVTNAELLSAVLKMQDQVNSFIAADGYGGRLLLVEKKIDDNCGEIEKLDHAINGNGQTGIKVELQEVNHKVGTILGISKFVLTPLFVGVVGLLIKLLFDH